MPQLKAHQCRKFKFWRHWPVPAGQADRCTRGRAQTYLIAKTLYYISLCSKLADGGWSKICKILLTLFMDAPFLKITFLSWFYKNSGWKILCFLSISHINVQLIGVFVSLLLFQNNCIAVLKQKVFLWHFSDFLLCIKVSEAAWEINIRIFIYLFPFKWKNKY